jgi:hypothetical protein
MHRGRARRRGRGRFQISEFVLLNARAATLRSRPDPGSCAKPIHALIGPAPVGMRSRASGAACLHASFCCFCDRALAPSELRLFPISFSCFLDLTFLGRAMSDRAGARPYHWTASANQIVEPRASSPRCSLYDRGLSLQSQDLSV